MTFALLLSALSAWYMTGVIWTVQRVHYALFAQVGPSNWETYHNAHTQRITPIVLLPMIVELFSSGWLAIHSASPLPRHWIALAWAAFALAIGTWAITFLVSVPLHSTLGRGYNINAIHRLVQTNWARTALWSAHSVIALRLLWERLPPL